MIIYFRDEKEFAFIASLESKSRKIKILKLLLQQ